MHSVLDIVAGLGLVAVLFVPVLPLVDWLDPIILQSEHGGLALFLVGLFLCFCTPGGDRWTPARGDTFVVLGSCTGLIMGAWINYQTGVIRGIHFKTFKNFDKVQIKFKFFISIFQIVFIRASNVPTISGYLAIIFYAWTISTPSCNWSLHGRRH